MISDKHGVHAFLTLTYPRSLSSPVLWTKIECKIPKWSQRVKRPENHSQNLGQPAIFSSVKLEAVGILVPLQVVISKSEEASKIPRRGDRACLNGPCRQQSDLGDSRGALSTSAGSQAPRAASALGDFVKVSPCTASSFSCTGGWSQSPPDRVAGTGAHGHSQHAVNVSCCCFLRCRPDFHAHKQHINRLNSSIFIFMKIGKEASIRG